MEQPDVKFVKTLKRPTKGFLCSLVDNTYGVDFLSFVIRDYDTKQEIFKVDKKHPNRNTMKYLKSGLGNSDDDLRTIRYDFSTELLYSPAISTKLVFAVGDKEIDDFRMIEKHFFRDKLVKSYDFKFGFCIPSSKNTWESIYKVPKLPDDLIRDMILHPYETKSDSFYFANGKLIMHNKAQYKYIASGYISPSLRLKEQKLSDDNDSIEEKKSSSKSPRNEFDIESLSKRRESKAAI